MNKAAHSPIASRSSTAGDLADGWKRPVLEGPEVRGATRSIASGRLRVLFYAPFTLLVLGCLTAILWMNGGVFVYALDDPYIHLALAARIQSGHYGINLAEASSPSSSILWPFLLAALPSSSNLGEYLPLLINLACTYVTLRIFLTVARPDDKTMPAGIFLLGLCAAIAINATGLVFIGMEHSLQVLLAVAGVQGLLAGEERRKIPPAAVAALIAGPFVRYENLAITVPACLWLALQGRGQLALRVLLPVLAGLVAFSAYLVHLGLPALPTSVLAKTGAANHSLAATLLTDLYRNAFDKQAVVLLLLSLPIAINLRRDASPDRRRIALFGTTLVVLHFLGGQFNWFSRYEIYVVASVLLILIHLYREQLGTLLTAKGNWRRSLAVQCGVTLLCLAAFQRYTRTAFYTPLASHAIYLQQYQTARFARDYWKDSIAVNDLGLASFGNPHYVLDLWGLGSQSALGARLDQSASRDPQWMDRLARQHGAGLAMIYHNWFPDLPSSWIPLAELKMSGWHKNLGDDTVTIYATRADAVPVARDELRHFATSLPSGAALTVF